MSIRIFVENNRNESKELHQKVIEHNHNLRIRAKEVIGHAGREVFACSPDNYVFGNLRIFDIDLLKIIHFPHFD